MRSWSIRIRLTVIATVVVTVLCVIASALITASNHGQVHEQRLSSAEAAAMRTVHLIKRGELTREIPRSAVRSGTVQVVDAQGRVRSGTGDLGSLPRLSRLEPPGNVTTGSAVQCGIPSMNGCKIVVVFRVYEADGDWSVYSLDDPVPWYISASFLGQVVGWSLLLIAFTAVGTALVVGRALRPVEDIRAQAWQIGLAVAGGRDFGRRIALPPHHDELRALTITANDMLARLEASIVREREFTSNTSHDLRTPLTAMRTELDEALLYPHDTEWESLARRLLASVERLQNLVEDLLVLARLDAGTGRKHERLDLGDVVAEELHRQRTDRNIRIDSDIQEAVVNGSRIQLARLFNNLLNNALRHADQNVTIRVRTEGRHAILEVGNDGDTIPPDLREAVFDRFTRLDPSRTKDTGGSGLGLSIVREIAAAHHGTATLADTDRTLFIVRIPRA
ncbi:sensor histidine kinase [Actinocorallia populi]|uniref:sensor histidine kinase n=1 Tax=Actinocorallia populi TaxID=2079200 RepID=UPI001300B845|nr:ATP-binding protein [Actinocorallia populi]